MHRIAPAHFSYEKGCGCSNRDCRHNECNHKTEGVGEEAVGPFAHDAFVICDEKQDDEKRWRQKTVEYRGVVQERHRTNRAEIDEEAHERGECNDSVEGGRLPDAPAGRCLMALGFPNESRYYDEAMHAVRFWGHDGAMEASFFVGGEALTKLQADYRLKATGTITPETLDALRITAR